MQLKNITIDLDDKRIKEFVKYGLIMLAAIIPMITATLVIGYKINSMKKETGLIKNETEAASRTHSEISALDSEIAENARMLPKEQVRLTKEIILADLNDACRENQVKIKKIAEQPVIREGILDKWAFLLTVNGQTSNVLSILEKLSQKHAIKITGFEAEDSQLTFLIVFTNKYEGEVSI